MHTQQLLGLYAGRGTWPEHRAAFAADGEVRLRAGSGSGFGLTKKIDAARGGSKTVSSSSCPASIDHRELNLHPGQIRPRACSRTHSGERAERTQTDRPADLQCIRRRFQHASVPAVPQVTKRVQISVAHGPKQPRAGMSVVLVYSCGDVTSQRPMHSASKHEKTNDTHRHRYNNCCSFSRSIRGKTVQLLHCTKRAEQKTYNSPVSVQSSSGKAANIYRYDQWPRK
jgi:hypothetical protein